MLIRDLIELLREAPQDLPVVSSDNVELIGIRVMDVRGRPAPVWREDDSPELQAFARKFPNGLVRFVARMPHPNNRTGVRFAKALLGEEG